MSKKTIPSLISSVKKLEKEIGHLVSKRISEFQRINRMGNDRWFSELCFCILTANSTAELGIKIQKEIGDGFIKMDKNELEQELKRLGHRFWRKRAEFIVEARRFLKIKDTIEPVIRKRGQHVTRDWIVRNVKGIGYKEASHFLRNVGYFDLAILDRHILAVMNSHGIIDDVPTSLTGKRYAEIEEKFLELSEIVSLKPGILDFYLWYMRTGKVLK